MLQKTANNAVTRLMLVSVLCLTLLASCNNRTQTPAAPPELETSPSQINFFVKPGAAPVSKELDIGIVNGISANWSAHVDQPWLTIQPKNGVLPRSFMATLPIDRAEITVDPSQLRGGAYEGAVSIDVEDKEQAGVVPVRLYVTNAEPGQTIDATVEPGTGDAWNTGIALSGPTKVSVGLWDDSLYVSGPDYKRPEYGPGDMIVLVQGTLSNESDNDSIVEYWAEGIDSAGKQVATGLDVGSPVGHLLATIPKHSSVDFTIHLSFAENIKQVAIEANRYDVVAPEPY